MDWLRRAIERAGGFEAVAEVSGISVPHLYAVCRRHRGLTVKTRRKLEPHLPKIGKARWDAAILMGPVSTTDSARGNSRARSESTAAPS